MIQRLKIIILSLLTIVCIMLVGFNQEQHLNFTQYEERRQVWLEIAVSFHVLVMLLLTVFYYIKKDKKNGFTFLLCFGLDILVLAISAFIMVLNFEGIQLKF